MRAIYLKVPVSTICVHLQREAPAGLSPFGYVAGRILWDTTLIGLWPAIFVGFYYMLTTFRVRCR